MLSNNAKRAAGQSLTEYALALALIVLTLMSAAKAYEASLGQYWGALKACFSLPTP
jgi:Flp pilus assembly pilin Flp